MVVSASSTLEEVAKLLPSEQRERFLLMCARFKSVPQDDEYLQVLEAIGFMTLLWQRVPEDIQEILKSSAPRGSNEELKTVVHDAIKESVPSYEDLRRMAERLENHETALKRIIRTQADAAAERPSRLGWVFPFATGALVSAATLYFLFLR